MRIFQILFSPAGGTQKAARLLASGWDAPAQTIDLCDPACDFSQYSFQPEDLVLLALPSYGGRVPALAAQRLALLRGNGARCVLLCVYGNRAYEDTLVEMQDLAGQCGFQVVAGAAAIAEHSILHQYAAGRPDAADAQQLRSFARAILKKLNAGTPGAPLTLPGNRPYKKAGGGGMVPKATKDCVRCGVCAQRCPAQAIDPADPTSTDAKKCISCMRCTVECPHAARKLNGAVLAAAGLALKKACSVRKECELFL